MALEHLLVHRAEVRRRVAGVDRIGQPNESWTTVDSDVPCRATSARGGERNTERMRETYEVSHEVFFQPDVDVVEDDELILTNQAGQEIFPQARIVLKRAPTDRDGVPHHIEVFCGALRGPQ